MKCEHEFIPIEFERDKFDEDFVGVWKICKKCNQVRLEPISYEWQERKT